MIPHSFTYKSDMMPALTFTFGFSPSITHSFFLWLFLISLRWSQNDSSSHHSPHLGVAPRLRYNWEYLRELERRDLATVWRKLLQVIRFNSLLINAKSCLY